MTQRKDSVISTKQRDRIAAAMRGRGGRRDVWHAWMALPEADRAFWRRDIDTALAYAGVAVRDLMAGEEQTTS